MHLPDGFLNVTTCAATGAVAGGAAAWAVRQLRAEVGDRLVPLMGVMSACIFAAQMVNFPIAWGTSGHLVGGVLAAIVLGPWGAVLSMTVVLIIQCFLFYDGGLTALGANVVNMALVGGLGGYAVYTTVRRIASGPAADVVAAVIASWVSVMVAAALCGVELWWSGTYPLQAVLPAMLTVHSLIGVGEALITGSVVAFLLRVRPDLLYARRVEHESRSSARQLVLVGVAAALFVAFFLSPLASAAPDGLERVVEDLGPIEAAATPGLILLPDYEVAGLGGIWLATSLAGLIGVLAVFALAWILSRGLVRAAK